MIDIESGLSHCRLEIIDIVLGLLTADGHQYEHLMRMNVLDGWLFENDH